MKKGTSKAMTKKTRARGMTRREFVGSTLAVAGVFGKAPALLRGQNLNNKLDIAFIAAGGRANASMSELTITPGRGSGGGRGRADADPSVPHPDENVTVLCDVNGNALETAS